VNEDVRKKNFAKNVVEKEELKIGGEVGIDTVLAKELVMFDMIFLTDDNMISNRRQDSKDQALTLKAAAYGIPIGRLAKMANVLFCHTRGNARLCVISWIARNKL